LTPDFLDADCVISALFSKGFLAKKLWKLTRGTTNSYDVTFELENSARIIGFTIYIKGTYHCLGITALVNQSKRFNITVEDIIKDCAIE
jgi:hypothetical protein